MNRTAIRLALVATALVVGACAGETDEVTDDATRSADSDQDAAQDAAQDDGSETDDSPGEAGARTTPDGSPDGDGPPPAGANGDRPSGDAPAGGGAAGGAASGSGGSAGGAPAGGGGSAPRPLAPDAPPPFLQLDPDPSTYDRYVRLARELGGEVANITEATALASAFCSDPAGSSETYLGGQALSTYPSDLALVRAYCPDKESQF